MKPRTAFALITLLASVPLHSVPPPGLLHHQGRIAVDGSNFDGNGHLKFALVGGRSGEHYWSNDGSGLGPLGTEPTSAVPVAVSNGHYSLALGDTTLANMTGEIPATVFTANGDVRLRIWFAPAAGGPFEQLTPDRRITPAAYALSAAEAQSVAAGAVTSEHLADGAVSGLDTPNGSLLDVVRVDENGRVGIGTGADLLESLVPTPSPRGSQDTLPLPKSIALQGNYAYVVGYDPARLQSLDISDPDAIVALDADGTNLIFPRQVVVQGDYAYVADSSAGGLQIFDISNPHSIVARGFEGTNLSAPQAVAVQGDSAYVVDSSTGLLQIFDVSDPNNIVPRDSDGTNLSSPQAVAVQGHYAYVVDTGTDLLQIFDISFSTAILALDSDGTNVSFPRSVVVRGDYAYVTDATTDVLQVFDVSNPNAIMALDSDGTNLGSPVSIAVAGDYAYVIDTETNLLQVFDVSNPNTIEPLGFDGSTLFNPNSIAIQGNLAYVTQGFTGLKKLQVFELVPQAIVNGSLQLKGGVVFADGSIQSRAFGADSVTAKDIADDAVTSGKIADDAVGSAEIVDGSISSADLDPASVGLWDVIGSWVFRRGRVGINVDLPEELLHIVGTSDPALKIQSLANDDIAGRIALRQLNESGYDLYYDGSSAFEGLRIDPLVSGTADPTALFLSNKTGARGYVGVGTTDPLAPLHVDGTARVQGVVNAGLTTAATDSYHFFATGTVNPLSDDMGNAGDVFINRDLEVAQTIYVGNSVSQLSDRDAKEQFAAVDSAAILKKVAALPLTTWQYKPRESDEGALPVRHLGPVAQDFHAAFGLGADDRHISTVDTDGVALAAIQGLNAKVDAENKALRSENARLQARLDHLEKAIEALSKEDAEPQPLHRTQP